MGNTVSAPHNRQSDPTERSLKEDLSMYHNLETHDTDSVAMRHMEISHTPEQHDSEDSQVIRVSGHRVIVVRHAADSHEFGLAA